MNRTFLLSALCLFGHGLIAQTKAPAPPLVAQGVDVNFESKEQAVDMDALRRWLQDKRLVSLKELGGDLSISGEVRSELKYTNEKAKAQGSSKYIQQRGMNSATSIPGKALGSPILAWDVEFNLMLDYHTDRTWAAMKVEFDNIMGTRSGTTNRIKLEKAYLGGRLIAQDTFTWDAEIGRRYLGNVFDSRIQFGSLFDGGLFRFSKAFQEIGDFYTNIGAFAINNNGNQYGEVMEMGALKIANTPLNMRYSIINWYRHYSQEDLYNGTPQTGPEFVFTQPWRYLVNQYTIFYQAYPTWFGKRLVKVYAAGLWNAMAKKIVQTGHRRANFGWYAGVSLGTVKKGGDWALDTNFQWAQAQVAPPVDCSGISTGNPTGQGFLTTVIDGSGQITTSTNAFSPFNYKGFEIDALYAFTSNLTVQQHFAWSWTLNRNIGPYNIYKQYEVEFIYAF